VFATGSASHLWPSRNTSVQIAEDATALGVRFIALRNEQATSYAATTYGYLTGKPGVYLVVGGGPGVLYVMAGIGNTSANAFPLLLLARSGETYQITQGAFQEMDVISLLALYTRIGNPATPDSNPQSILSAYRTFDYSWEGCSIRTS
jgi:2-hydroxyacyl-CoA lyase 1